MNVPSASARQAPSLETTGSSSWFDAHATTAALVIAAVVRLALGAFIPLAPDEAYYWDWSRHLAAGYFDHPPAIAILVRGGTMLLGDTPLGVRLLPQLAALVAMFVSVSLASRVGGPLGARWAALTTTALPIAAVGLLVATPDAPLLMMTSFTLLAMLRAIGAVEGTRALGWWLVAGFCLGVGFLAKYTAVILPLGALAALLTHRALRPQLTKPGPYVAGMLAIAVTAPVVLWNAHHDWVSFAFQLQHGLGRARGSAALRELTYLGGIAFLSTPILCMLLAMAVGRALRKQLGAGAYLLAVTATTWVAFFAYSSLRHRPEPNWSAPALVAAVPLIALGMSPRAAAWLRGGVAFGIGVALLVYAGLLFPGALPSAARGMVTRTFDWRRLADDVTPARRELAGAAPNGSPLPSNGGLATPVHRTWIAADRYQIAAELAFVLPDHPAVFALNLGGRPNQYDYWPGFPDRASIGDDMLLVLEVRATSSYVIDKATPSFTSVTQLERGRADGYRLWRLRGWRGGWPRTPMPTRSNTSTTVARPATSR